MYSLQPNAILRPTVNELLSYYKRQKIVLRDDGTRLIRAIARPEFMINNDDVVQKEVLGKVSYWGLDPAQLLRFDHDGTALLNCTDSALQRTFKALPCYLQTPSSLPTHFMLSKITVV
jgi:hypothetical protein